LTTRDRIELGFVRWGHFVFRHARAVIAAAALLTAGFASQLPELVIDGSDDAFLQETDPVRTTFESYRAQFGHEDTIAIAIQAPEIFDLRFLEKLRALHRDLERELPQVEEITSLINARYTHGLEDELVVEDLLEEWPGSAADLARLEARVRANPLYRNWLISESARTTTVVIELDPYSSIGVASDALSGFEDSEPLGDPLDRPFLTGEEVFAIVGTVYDVVARHDAPDFRLAVAGGPVGDVAILEAMQRDMAVAVVLSVLVIALLLFLLFRRLSGVALPLVVVALSLLCTIGTMAMAEVPLTLPMQVLPTFLLAVGVCASIHLMAIFFRTLESGESREQAIAHALGHSGVAIVLTSLTTAGGLVAFASAELAPVMHFGIFGPVGVFFALAFTLVLLPALLAVTPLRQARRRPPGAAPSDRLLLRFGEVATHRPRVVLFVAALLVVAGVTGAWRLRFSWEPLGWFPESEPVRVATELVDREFGGSSTIAVMLDTGVENGFHDPALLARLDELRVYAESLTRGPMSVGKTVSVADVLKEINQALNENRPEYYAIPGDRRLVAQEFLLFENAGSDDLEDVVDSRFAVANFTLRVPSGDAFESAPFLDEVEAHFREVLGDRVRVTMTGDTVVNGRIFTAMIVSMTRSYAAALLIVTPLMVLLLGNLRGGLIAMIPNLIPIILTLGLMGWLGCPLDFATMMIGAVILGVAVDDTIHFVQNFQRFYRGSGDPEGAVRRALETTGRAMLFTSIVLAAGFFVWTLATMASIVRMGLFAGFAVIAAFLADVLVAPALMVLFQRRMAGSNKAV